MAGPSADELVTNSASGVRTIIVETASRFARDLMVQEAGHEKLRERGINLIAADNPSWFLDDTPTAKLVGQVLGAIFEFDKAMTVAKLRGARERKRPHLRCPLSVPHRAGCRSPRDRAAQPAEGRLGAADRYHRDRLGALHVHDELGVHAPAARGAVRTR